MKKLALVVLLFALSALVTLGNTKPIYSGNDNKTKADTPKPASTLVYKEKQRFSAATQIVSLGTLSPFTLKTTIDESGITYCYSPLNIKSHTILWKDIDSAYVRTYKPVMEYGGWGIKYSFKHGKVYNVKGKEGLQLVLKNGKHILFGTQKPEDVKKFINVLASAGIVKEKRAAVGN